jgi:hypothetical protein
LLAQVIDSEAILALGLMLKVLVLACFANVTVFVLKRSAMSTLHTNCAWQAMKTVRATDTGLIFPVRAVRAVGLGTCPSSGNRVGIFANAAVNARGLAECILIFAGNAVSTRCLLGVRLDST